MGREGGRERPGCVVADSPGLPLSEWSCWRGAMGDGGGFLCHGNGHDGSEIRVVVVPDGVFRHKMLPPTKHIRGN